MLPRTTRTLSISLGEGDALPTEFRLFTSGWNDTENGRYLFDAQAASAVMTAYAKWGVDLAIDLEHQMLEPGIAPDPTAKDARGWCRLELRDDGSLWAVGVTWTADGAARLSEKRQRYVSPAFGVDPETSRITSILNVAITAIPATHDTPALVAARRQMPKDLRKLATGPSFDDIRIALGEALEVRYRAADPMAAMMGCPWVVDVYDATVVYQIDGGYWEVPYTLDGATVALGEPAVAVVRSFVPAAPAPVPVTTTKKKTAKLAVGGTGMDPKLIQQALDALIAGDDAKCSEILKGLVASAAGADTDAATEDAPPPKGDGGADENVEAAAEVAAASARMLRLTGVSTFVEAVEVLSTFRDSHLKLETERAALAAERSTLEAAERRKGCADMVLASARKPSEVWADDSATAPKAYLAAMPIADFRQFVKDALAASSGKKTTKTPPTVELDAHGLTPAQLKICKETGCDPATFAMLKRRA